MLRLLLNMSQARMAHPAAVHQQQPTLPLMRHPPVLKASGPATRCAPPPPAPLPPPVQLRAEMGVVPPIGPQIYGFSEISTPFAARHLDPQRAAESPLAPEQGTGRGGWGSVRPCACVCWAGCVSRRGTLPAGSTPLPSVLGFLAVDCTAGCSGSDLSRAR